MTDMFSKELRSWVMSRIKGRWTSHERWLHNWLKGHHVRHRMHPDLPGTPDLLVYPSTVVFINGCFWHACPRCYVPPKTNREFWNNKRDRNKARDKRNVKMLANQGWKVLTIWEHEIKR